MHELAGGCRRRGAGAVDGGSCQPLRRSRRQQRGPSSAAPQLQQPQWLPEILKPGLALPWMLSAACRPRNGVGPSCCERSAR